jgi:hypothetical protein
MQPALSDPTLGDLHWNEQHFGYDGKLYPGAKQEVRLLISLRECADKDKALQDARSTFEVISRNIPAAAEFAERQLLQFKNGEWLEEGEDPVSSSDFRSRIKLTSIALYPDGECELYFEDGGLFAGHYILVLWRPRVGFHQASVEG